MEDVVELPSVNSRTNMSSPALYDHILFLRLLQGAGSLGHRKCIVNDRISARNLSADFCEKRLPRLCFPSVTKRLRVLSEKYGNYYSFATLDEMGKRIFVFCHYVDIPQTSDSLPAMDCICLVGRRPWFPLYAAILKGIGESLYILGSPMSSVKEYLQAILLAPIPTISAQFHRVDARKASSFSPVQLFHPSEDQPAFSECDYSLLLCNLGVELTLEYFFALLLEKQVVVISRDLVLLCSVMHSAIELLRPFVWQYSFIPVVPSSLLKQMCLSSRPFCIGLHASVLPEILRFTSMGSRQYVIIDVDNSQSNTPVSTMSCKPQKMTRILASHLREAVETGNLRTLFANLIS